jgi:uncharacterized protein DUF4105
MHMRVGGVRRVLAWVVLGVGCLVLAWVGYRLVLVRPSNDRDWEFGVDRLPLISVQDGRLEVRNLRDFRYTADGGTPSAEFVDRSFDLDGIQQAWFVQEPFTIAPLTAFEGVAHTYFVFDFQDQPPLAVSVESRRERAERYDAILGLFNEYELIYLWGTEPDLTGRRAVLEKHAVFMYPLTIPTEGARALLLQLADSSQQLVTTPRFYNTLTSNCTNELAKAANKVKPDAIPPNIALVLPGYSDKLLYDLGYIPNDAPLPDVRKRYSISDLVVATYGDPEAWKLVRAALHARER